jgi:hypothetical protein
VRGFAQEVLRAREVGGLPKKPRGRGAGNAAGRLAAEPEQIMLRSMSDGYRDPLGAALARVEALERENAALKNAPSDRPATAAEVGALLRETEISRLEKQREAIRLKGVRIENLLRQWSLARWTLCSLVFAVEGVTGLVIGRPPLVLFGCITTVSVYWSMYVLIARKRHEKAALEPERERLAREIARLRRQPGRVGTLPLRPVRVAMLDEVNAVEEHASSSHAARRRT